MDRRYFGSMKKFLVSAVCAIGGFVFCGLLMVFGILYIAVCVIRELADYLFRKIKRS